MAKGSSVETAKYVLSAAEDGCDSRGGCAQRDAEFLPEPLLVGNALWFCRLRWVVVAALVGFGLLGRSQGAMDSLGLRMPGLWPVVTAGILSVGNLVFLTHVLLLKSRSNGGLGPVLWNLWGQILTDLLVLAVVVHFIGSTQTYVAFVFLFHIVAACLLLPPRQSLLLTVSAMALYGGCVLAEQTGLILSTSIFADGEIARSPRAQHVEVILNAVSAMALWLVVWYLTSRLSRTVRRRDLTLAQTNQQLRAARDEKNRHMMVTTHQLKAPFAAMYTHAQVLLEGYCGKLPEPAVPILKRILARCRRLATEIQEMLQLANLNSGNERELVWSHLDLAELMRWSVEQVISSDPAENVTFKADLEPAPTVGVEEHLKMLMSNAVRNAVNYSRPGGQVRLKCRPRKDGGAILTVADDGIGIPIEKLPRIFDEYYRTNEAVRHKKESSGLGLTIVRDAARLHRIHVAVTSRPGVGTTFEFHFPPPGPATVPPG